MLADAPFSQACENNKHPILEKLKTVFQRPGTVLEIGTGTGQHAVFFAEALPHIDWQPSDHPDNIHLCRARVDDAALNNIRPPVALDVAREPWPIGEMDGVFSANTAHIMAWPEVVAMFEGVARRLPPGGAFCLYGPFNINGRFTSDSNRQFDRHLRERAGHMGLRDRDELERLAGRLGLTLEADHELPANNRLLVWRKVN